MLWEVCVWNLQTKQQPQSAIDECKNPILSQNEAVEPLQEEKEETRGADWALTRSSPFVFNSVGLETDGEKGGFKRGFWKPAYL